MLTPLDNFEQMVGKTVRSIVEWGYGPERLAIAFTDGTYLCVGVEHNYVGDHQIIVGKPYESELYNEDSLEAGIVTYDDIAKYIIHLAEEKQRAERDHERKERRPLNLIQEFQQKAIAEGAICLLDGNLSALAKQLMEKAAQHKRTTDADSP